jgi:membrane-bound lytic murein transglycosylase D
MLGILGLVSGLSHDALAQKKQLITSDSAIAVTPVSVDSSITTARADSTGVQLNPVVTSGASATDDKYVLLEPAVATSPANFISGNLNNFVIQFIKNYYEDNTRNLQDMQTKSGSYFNLIEKVFDRFGIPEELKYLAVIESGLNTNARSQAGAVGAWQLMSGTARLLGLKVSRHRDDRRDLYKSTVAAAKYLSQLHDRFGNWLLVIAAYNCGPGGVLKAISESGSDDFWDLKKYLPRESQRHVLKFLATAYILDRFASFFGVDKAELFGNDFQPLPEKPVTQMDNSRDMATLNISGRYSLPVIAEHLSMSINELNKLNPGLDELLSNASSTYTLHLPADKMVIFKEKKAAILNESVEVLMENNRQLADASLQAPRQTAPVVAKANGKG